MTITFSFLIPVPDSGLIPALALIPETRQPGRL
jgi:hypothetical protein